MMRFVRIMLILISLCLVGCSQSTQQNSTALSSATEKPTVPSVQEDREFWAEFVREESTSTWADTKTIIKLFLDDYNDFYNAKDGKDIPNSVFGLFGVFDVNFPENTDEHNVANMGWDAIDELYHGNITVFQEKAEEIRQKVNQLKTVYAEGLGWEKAFYVDDFGDKTSDWYIRGKFKGSFSNSATSGSRLTVFFFVDHDYSKCSKYDKLRLRLVEYGDLVVNFKNVDYKNVMVKIKIDDTVYSDYPSNVYEKELGFQRQGELFTPILKALEEGKEIKFVITESQYTTSTYQFTIDSRGLTEIPHTWTFN